MNRTRAPNWQWRYSAIAITKYVGAYLAALSGAEAIIFGGGIGEDTPWVRTQVCSYFGWCGLELENAVNEALINREGRISSKESAVHAWVIPTEESLMIAHQAALLGSNAA